MLHYSGSLNNEHFHNISTRFLQLKDYTTRSLKPQISEILHKNCNTEKNKEEKQLFFMQHGNNII